ncbi:MAG: hypothetical protein V2A61_06110, partial [Calditrichota bacterium]
NFNPDRENYAFRCGWTRRGDRSWATFGVGWQQRQDNTLIAYSIAVDTDGWDETIHFLTYGYCVRAQPSIVPMPGMWKK